MTLRWLAVVSKWPPGRVPGPIRVTLNLPGSPWCLWGGYRGLWYVQALPSSPVARQDRTMGLNLAVPMAGNKSRGRSVLLMAWTCLWVATWPQ